jgi:hypothetical protein
MSEKLRKEAEVPIESNIEKGSVLSLEQLDSLFREKPQVIEEMKKGFSVSLHRAFATSYEGRSIRSRYRVDPYSQPITRNAGILVRTFEEMIDPPPAFAQERKAWQSDRAMILGDGVTKHHLADCIIKIGEPIPGKQTSTWLSFVFSVDDETAKRYWNQGQLLGEFAAPQDIQFHGTYVGIPLKEKRVPLSDALQSEKFSDVTANRKLIDWFLKFLDRPVVECKEAQEAIEHVGDELGIKPEKIETLKRAVQDFATYVKPEPKTNEQCFQEIGRCFTVPCTFSHFADEWHELKIDTDFYEQSAGGHPTFFHQVNVLDGKMVVDWTARQYKQFDKESYPFIYRVGDPQFKSWGHLVSLERGKRKATLE